LKARTVTHKSICFGVAGILLACAFTLPASAKLTQATILSNFKDAVDIVVANGVSENVPPIFCGRFELDCAGQPWPVRKEVAANNKETKEIMVGKLAGQDVVLLIRQDNDKARVELYVSNALGRVLRGYSIIDNGTPSLMPTDRAGADFEGEKKWWLDWLSAPHS
jgi:hypothetical protein